MIDRDRATEIITEALNNLGQLANTLTPDAHARRIAAALDALGLLVMATDPAHEQADVNDIVGKGLFDDINPAPTAEEIAGSTLSPEQRERIATEAVAILDETVQLGQPHHWAGKRQRL